MENFSNQNRRWPQNVNKIHEIARIGPKNRPKNRLLGSQNTGIACYLMFYLAAICYIYTITFDPNLR